VLPPNLSNRASRNADRSSATASTAARAASSPSLRLRGEPSSARSTSTAGHGVLPSVSGRPLDSTRPIREPAPRQGFVQRTLLGGTALGLSVPPPFPAGHGLLSSFWRRAG
jgi:hypothetical protein